MLFSNPGSWLTFSSCFARHVGTGDVLGDHTLQLPEPRGVPSSTTASNKYSLLMHCIKIESNWKFSFAQIRHIYIRVVFTKTESYSNGKCCYYHNVILPPEQCVRMRRVPVFRKKFHSNSIKYHIPSSKTRFDIFGCIYTQDTTLAMPMFKSTSLTGW